MAWYDDALGGVVDAVRDYSEKEKIEAQTGLQEAINSQQKVGAAVPVTAAADDKAVGVGSATSLPGGNSVWVMGGVAVTLIAVVLLIKK